METLVDLARLSEDGGPFLSVYALTDQWLALREELTAQGAPESALALVDPLLRSDETVAVIATENELLVTEHLSEQFLFGRAQWAGTPDLVPLIKDRQERGAEEIEDDDERRALKTQVAEETVRLLERFKAEAHADGIRETVAAMTRAEVDVLLVRDDRDERHNVAPEDATVIDGLIRDAIATGASVHVIPASGPVTEGVGALLR